MPNKDLFFMVMEADGDEMQAFDENAPAPEDAGADETTPAATEEPSGGEGDVEAPPEMNEDDFGMGGLNDMDSGESSEGEETSGEGGGDEEADKQDTKLSTKANDILNQSLYTKFVNRNREIEDIITSIKDTIPLLPNDIIKSNDKSMNQLKAALQKGQEYVINDFVDSGYGENLLFYQKLDSLYVLLLNRIDTNLRKIDVGQ